MKNEWVLGIFAVVNVLGYLAIEYIVNQYPDERQVFVMVPGLLAMVSLDIVALATLAFRKRDWFAENKGTVIMMLVFLALICALLLVMQFSLVNNPPA